MRKNKWLSIAIIKNVLVDKKDGITTVTLNRPDKRNAMSPELDEEMLDCILELEADTETLVLVLAGAGKASVCRYGP